MGRILRPCWQALNSMKVILVIFALCTLLGCKENKPQPFDETKLTPKQKVEWEVIKAERELREEKLWVELKDNPPKPPWIAFPDYDRHSMGWRMGGGEDHVFGLYVYFKNINEEQKEEYRLKYPEPQNWEGWYEE